MSKSSIVFLLLLVVACTHREEQSFSIVSPNGELMFVLDNSSPEGDFSKLSYFLLSKSSTDTLIEPSAIGLEFSGKKTFTGQYKLINMVHENVRLDTYNQVVFVLTDVEKDTLKLRVKLFDKGLAFQYEKNGSKGDTIVSDLTSFNLPEGTAWIQPYDKVSKWSPGYEQPYMEVPIGTSSPNEEGWCFPILATSDNGKWLFVSEANLDGTYHATHLQPMCDSGNYQIRFPEIAEADSLVDPVVLNAQWRSPWRFIAIGDSLDQIISANLVDELADEPTGDYSWVKSGRSSWSWWSDHESSKNPASLRKFIDLAHEMTWEYSLIDANWDTFHEDTLKSLVSYASEKNIGIWLWYNSGGPHNTVTETPRDLMHERTTRREEFVKLKDWGIKGIKIDFFQSDKISIVQQYVDILKDAADFQLMINFHGCTLPRGWSKTYPHLLTMEAVRGAETYSFNKDWVAQAPIMNTIYPFTRNLVGSMDYTPVTFSKYPNGRITSSTHELALSVIFTSSIQHFADGIDGYQSQSQEVKKFLQEMPVVWEESKLLEGYPGDYVVVARRKGEKWYLAGINGTSLDKEITLNIALFPLSTNLLFIDGEKDSIISEMIDDNSQITVQMKPYGGFVAY